MAERKRVGLIFINHSHWTGGVYYILNLIHALNALEDRDKPVITVIAAEEKDYALVKKETKYPYLSFHEIRRNYSVLERGFNKAGQLLFSRQLIQKKIGAHFDLVFPFPLKDQYFSSIGKENRMFWIPDFQEDHYPEFFPESTVQDRKTIQGRIASDKNKIIFSSRDAAADFSRLYPQSLCEAKVVHFAVTHPQYSDLDMVYLRKKYGLPERYFISPNQFWKHKNHRLVIEAVDLLKKERKMEAPVVFTGKEDDYRNPGFAEELKKMVTQRSLSEHILFLGFIDRREQLQLMNHSLCVLQPSLFEGWSTVIEDAKAMNQYVLASDIAVHREQLTSNADFFDPYQAETLAVLMKKCLQEKPEGVAVSYQKAVENFGRAFIQAAFKNKDAVV